MRGDEIPASRSPFLPFPRRWHRGPAPLGSGWGTGSAGVCGAKGAGRPGPRRTSPPPPRILRGLAAQLLPAGAPRPLPPSRRRCRDKEARLRRAAWPRGSGARRPPPAHLPRSRRQGATPGSRRRPGPDPAGPSADSPARAGSPRRGLRPGSAATGLRRAQGPRRSGGRRPLGKVGGRHRLRRAPAPSPSESGRPRERVIGGGGGRCDTSHPAPQRRRGEPLAAETPGHKDRVPASDPSFSPGGPGGSGRAPPESRRTDGQTDRRALGPRPPEEPS